MRSPGTTPLFATLRLTSKRAGERVELRSDMGAAPQNTSGCQGERRRFFFEELALPGEEPLKNTRHGHP